MEIKKEIFDKSFDQVVNNKELDIMAPLKIQESIKTILFSIINTDEFWNNNQEFFSDEYKKVESNNKPEVLKGLSLILLSYFESEQYQILLKEYFIEEALNLLINKFKDEYLFKNAAKITKDPNIFFSNSRNPYNKTPFLIERKDNVKLQVFNFKLISDNNFSLSVKEEGLMSGLGFTYSFTINEDGEVVFNDQIGAIMG